MTQEYEKNTSGALEIIRLKEIANTPDEVIEMFDKTPIYNLLKQRREFARRLTYKIPIDKNGLEMMKFYDNQLREFFLA